MTQNQILSRQQRPRCQVCDSLKCQVSPHGSWICKECYEKIRAHWHLPTKMVFPKRSTLR